jgi:hypothetical protein
VNREYFGLRLTVVVGALASDRRTSAQRNSELEGQMTQSWVFRGVDMSVFVWYPTPFGFIGRTHWHRPQTLAAQTWAACTPFGPSQPGNKSA